MGIWKISPVRFSEPISKIVNTRSFARLGSIGIRQWDQGDPSRNPYGTGVSTGISVLIPIDPLIPAEALPSKGFDWDHLDPPTGEALSLCERHPLGRGAFTQKVISVLRRLAGFSAIPLEPHVGEFGKFRQFFDAARGLSMGVCMSGKTGEIEKKIRAFHAAVKAQALLVALDWAGGASNLSRAAGLDANTASLWIYRRSIPPRAALVLERIEGFPLKASEMCPGTEWARFRKRRCEKCNATIYPPNYRSGYPSLLKQSDKRSRKTSPVKRSPPVKPHLKTHAPDC